MSANHLNYLRSMGEVAFASLAETVRPAMVHGLRSYMETIGQLATNMSAIRMSVAEANLAGNVLERILGHMLEKPTGFDPLTAPLKAFDLGSAQSQRIQNRTSFGAFLGPSAGMADDLLTVGGIPKTVAGGAELSKGQRGAIERLIPFNSYLGLRQAIRYLVQPQQ